jgi:ethanolaminephosphotransferase
MEALNAEERHNVVNYKYHGGDLSPIYKHVLSPLAEWCVNTFVPECVAPNVITFAGLVISILATVITLWINPTLSPHETPRWVSFMVGMAIFSYQTLDNMDGKQARKTKSSSALGMFFDHGCDCINAGVSVIAVGAVLGTGWSGKLFITYLSSWIPFYFQTWEEYYTGSMLLPPFNGPTEGLLMAISVCFIAAAIGTEAFHQVNDIFYRNEPLFSNVFDDYSLFFKGII